MRRVRPVITPERRNRLVGLAARLIPHPDPPSPLALRLLRAEPARPLRRVIYGPVPRGVLVTDQVLELAGRPPLRLRCYQPRELPPGRPLLINFHGGGFVFGNLSQTDWMCGRLADRAGLTVISTSYRLAPEHPAPAAVEDAWAATRHLTDRAVELGVDPHRVGVMGNSAGGTLAALVALRARRRPLAVPLWRQVLIYPATDLTLSSASILELENAPLAARPVLDWYGRQYLPQGRPDRFDYADPRVSPIHAADPPGLPPAQYLAAGQRPLRDAAVRR